jgi:hypothetical protein
MKVNLILLLAIFRDAVPFGYIPDGGEGFGLTCITMKPFPVAKYTRPRSPA